MITANAESVRAPQEKPRKEREWHPRFWQGCDFFAWMRLLARNRFTVHWSCAYIAFIVTIVSFFNTVLRCVQGIWYGKRSARTTIREAPIFIIGHWRTGTTLLHEMLILDERHAYPTTYECMEPNHFLLTENIFTRWFRFLTPAHRPMDNMAAGFDRPMEDEFALCMLGQPSPYLTIAFPNRPPQYEHYLDLEGLSPSALASWKRTFLHFLKQLTFKGGKRLVLKSPPHSCRMRVLLEMFPDARFVHIVRDPYVVFPSTVNLWKSLYRTHSLQKPTFAGLEEHVLRTFVRLYDKIEDGKKLIEPERFFELRYEDLVRDPVGEMQALYEQLELGGFDEFLPRLRNYLSSVAGYETNRYQVTDEQRAKVSERWGHVIRQYGYETLLPVKAKRPSVAASATGS